MKVFLVVLGLVFSAPFARAEVDNKACEPERKELAIKWTTEELQRYYNTTDVRYYGVNRAYKLHELLVKRFFTERGIVPIYKVFLQAKMRSGFYRTTTCKIYFETMEASTGCAHAKRLTCMDGDFEFSDRGPFIDRAL